MNDLIALDSKGKMAVSRVDMEQYVDRVLRMAKSNEYAKGSFSVSWAATGTMPNNIFEYHDSIVRLGYQLDQITSKGKDSFNYIEHLDPMGQDFGFVRPPQHTNDNPVFNKYQSRRRGEEGIASRNLEICLNADFTLLCDQHKVSKKDAFRYLDVRMYVEEKETEEEMLKRNYVFSTNINKQTVYVEHQWREYKKAPQGLLSLLVPYMALIPLIKTVGLAQEMSICMAMEPAIECFIVTLGPKIMPMTRILMVVKTWVHLMYRRVDYFMALIFCGDHTLLELKKYQRNNLEGLSDHYEGLFKRWVRNPSSYGSMVQSDYNLREIDYFKQDQLNITFANVPQMDDSVKYSFSE